MQQQQGKQHFQVLEHPHTLLSSSKQVARHTNELISSPLPRREQLEGELSGTLKDKAFMIESLLTPEECQHYIQECERVGFESLAAVFPSHYRSNDRILTLSHEVAGTLFKRIQPLLQQSDLQWQPMGPGSDGVWLPCGLNECIKFGRYRPGCRFSPHVDGPWAPSEDKCSIFTVLVYLNDEDSSQGNRLVGGETNFLFPPTAEGKEEKGQHLSEERDNIDDGGENESFIARSQKEHRVVCYVKPKAGSALLFLHNMLHEGAILQEGIKYVMRTELMFRRVCSPLGLGTAQLSVEEDADALVKLYRKSEEHFEKGHGEEFVESYLAALNLQCRHTHSPHIPEGNSSLRGLPVEVSQHLLSFLPLKDVASFMLVDKRSYRVARTAPLWRMRNRTSMPRPSHGFVNNGNSQSSVSTDWYSECRLRLSSDSRTQSKPVQSPLHAICRAETHRGWDRRNMPRAVMAGDIGEGTEPETTTIVCDTGGGYWKTGFSYESDPRQVQPAVSVHNYSGRHSHSLSNPGPTRWIGKEAEQARVCTHYAGAPMCIVDRERGFNWDLGEAMYHNTFYNQLRVAPEEHFLIATANVGTTRFKEEREKHVQVLVETFNVLGLTIATSQYLAMTYREGMDCLVLDFGDTDTYLQGFKDGQYVEGATRRLGLGGRDLKAYLWAHLLRVNVSEAAVAENLRKEHGNALFGGKFESPIPESMSKEEVDAMLNRGSWCRDRQLHSQHMNGWSSDPKGGYLEELNRSGWTGTLCTLDRQIMERLCYVSTDYSGTMAAYDKLKAPRLGEHTDLSVMKNQALFRALPTELVGHVENYVKRNDRYIHYELPDGRAIILGKERTHCMEPLFHPRLVEECPAPIAPSEDRNQYAYGRPNTKAAPPPQPDLKDLIAESIRGGGEEYSSAFMNSGTILVTGANSLLPGVVPRLAAEVATISPKIRIKPLDRDVRRFGSWHAGMLLANLSTFQEKCVSQDEYNEHGPAIINSRGL